MSEPPLALRQRKKLATHRALAGAARELTLARGLDAVTVEDIAEAAGVSPRTFFNYFSSKEQAIVGVDPDFLAELAAALTARPDGESPVEALIAVLVSDPDELNEAARRWELRAELTRQYPGLLARHLEAMAAVERVLVDALAARLDTDPAHDLYPTAVVTGAVAATRSTFAWWHANNHPIPLADALRQAFIHLSSGFQAPSPPRTSRER